MSPPFRVFRSLDEVPPDFGPSALTIGNFDGVHVGHRAILRRVKEVAAARGLKASVLTFHPHPSKVVAPARAPRLMTSPDERSALMQQEGIDQVVILPFNSEVAHLTPEQFVAQVLVEKLGVQAVLVGHDFCFGNKQAGNVRVLQELGCKYGFTTEEVKAVLLRGHLVSSTALRRLIVSGRVSQAGRLMGRPYRLEGEVVAGRGVGSKQTVPTLNLATETEVLPATGVYVTGTSDLDTGRAWPSVTNVGYRPTFGAGQEISIETFLLEPLAGATPHRIRVEFLRRVREERQFPDAAALKQQILRDVGRARAYFRRLKKWTKWSVFPVDSVA
ncbi:MAG TPA: bifunctional riboflavin kinase/FAD synthetase [Bryobacteraceae bacterium]|nr:bifunctional riboflavin kinase/FAD synthetase [Bryobacteraceae bacterium]